jgi:hypothetical protein
LAVTISLLNLGRSRLSGYRNHPYSGGLKANLPVPNSRGTFTSRTMEPLGGEPNVAPQRPGGGAQVQQMTGSEGGGGLLHKAAEAVKDALS